MAKYPMPMSRYLADQENIKNQQRQQKEDERQKSFNAVARTLLPRWDRPAIKPARS
jgi:hypothetical protein